MMMPVLLLLVVLLLMACFFDKEELGACKTRPAATGAVTASLLNDVVVQQRRLNHHQHRQQRTTTTSSSSSSMLSPLSRRRRQQRRMAALATASSLSATTSFSSQLLPNHHRQTPDDVAFETWARKNGIFFSNNIKCVTTSRSVGGRGLFVVGALVQSGQVLASIPRELIFHSNDSKYWAADITSQVLKVMKSHNGDDCRREWVESWSGGGCKSFDEARELLGAFGFAADDDLEEQIRKRIVTRIAFWEEGADKYRLDRDNDFDLYSLVCSRACHLGPTWTKGETAIGVVPLFDMLNHYPSQHNVELVSVKTALERMSDARNTVDDSGNSEVDDGSSRGSKSNKPPKGMLDEKDMLLVATKDIDAGAELLTSYVDDEDVEEADDVDDVQTTDKDAESRRRHRKLVEIKARKLVQWGFL